MSNAYTYDVETGKIVSLRDFAFRCARAFGAAIEQREESFDVPLRIKREVNSYHLDQLQGTLSERKAFLAKSDKELQAKLDQMHASNVRNNAVILKKVLEEKERFASMAKKIDEWEPTNALLFELKQFMVQQIKDAIQHSSDPAYYERPLVKQTLEEYKKDMLDMFDRSIEYHTQSYKKEQENCKKANEWFDALVSAFEE